ncbi:hypothetical protein B0H13DRAFT_2000688 [Mycena leptocephala]|nr:hypothetical protein B0H13DRAFT_2000688 [Mycena leptocephala]
MVDTTHTKTTASERAVLAATRLRIADIDAQILELERTYRSIQEEKAVLQEQLDAYVYPVLILPPPPPKTGLLSPNILCQVCRTWREIALSTPALWRAVRVFLFNGDKRKIEAGFRALETSLMRSGSCPLSIELVSGPFIEKELPPFIRSIAAHWPLLSLRSLTIGLWASKDDSALPAIFHTAPLLRKVALQRYKSTHHAIIPWSQLTVLIVDIIRPDECGLVLNHTPRLVHCRLVIDVPDEEPSVAPPAVDSLLHLEMLVLRTRSRFEDRAKRLFNSLTLPALRRLQVSDTLLFPNPVTAFGALIARSACHLQQIHILDSGSSVDPCRPCRRVWPTVDFSCGPQLELKSMFFGMFAENQDGVDNDEEATVWKDPQVYSDSESGDEDSNPNGGSDGNDSEGD